MKNYLPFLLLLGCFLIATCSCGSNTVNNSSANPHPSAVVIGLLPNGSTIYLSQNNLSVNSGSVVTVDLFLDGGTSNESYNISFTVTRQQPTKLAATGDNYGIEISSTPTSCIIGTAGSGASPGCQLKVAVTPDTYAATYLITPTASPAIQTESITILDPLILLVSGASIPSSKEFTSFSLNGINGVINGYNIAVTVPYGTDVSNLVATYAVTGYMVDVDGVEQVSGISANDFSSPVVYTVIAEDGSTQDYTVTVTAELPDPMSIIKITLPQTGQLLCVPAVSYSATCTSLENTSPIGSDGYGRPITTAISPGVFNNVPFGVEWAFSGDSQPLIPVTRFTAGAAADGVACNAGEEIRQDNLTGLMWVQNPPATDYSWESGNLYPALAAVAEMNKAGYCGYNDWRLPNINELTSLANLGTGTAAHSLAEWLQTQGFGRNLHGSLYLSATTFADNHDQVWIMSFDDSQIFYDGKSYDGNYVLPVRSGRVSAAPAQIPQTGQTISYAPDDDGSLQTGTFGTINITRFTVGDGVESACVTDQQTGLLWLKDPGVVNNGNPANWSLALALANNGNWCGYSDWRLPNRNELRSLGNYGAIINADWLNTVGFQHVQADFYWSSTTYAYNITSAWRVTMYSLDTNFSNKDNNHYVWPVRGGR